MWKRFLSLLSDRRTRYVRSSFIRLAIWSNMIAFILLVTLAVIRQLGWIEADTLLVYLRLTGFLLLVSFLASLIGMLRAARLGIAGFREGFVMLLITLIVFSPYIYGLRQVITYPLLNDISTNLDDVPQFLPMVERLNGRDKTALDAGQATRDKQNEGYPHIKTQDFSLDSKSLYALALNISNQLGWQLVEATPPVGDWQSAKISSFAETWLWRFRDDIVIRIRPTDSQHSTLDIRSRSRLGQHDLGANARRIEIFFETIAEALANANRLAIRQK